jgi:Mce-associated membrane protein
VTTTQNDEKVDETTAAVAESDVEQSEERVVDTTVETEGAADESEPEAAEPSETKRRVNWSRVLAYGVLPGLAVILAMAAGFLKWQHSSVRDAEVVRMESVQAAKTSTVAMLSYKPDTVEQQLGAARDLLAGEFRDSYSSLTNDVVIPGAKEKQISATATVPAAASVSAEPNHAVVLVFVNQTVVMGDGAPTDTASTVRVGLDKIDGRWLISKFDPV